MAIPIINSWQNYYPVAHEGLGSSYERVVLNRLLSRLKRDYGFSRVLEAPCFGFTGITGINLVSLAQAGCEVYLEDDNEQRLELIRTTWMDLGLPVSLRLNQGFTALDYPDGHFDFAFNFSALWFVANLGSFLKELCRVVRGPILLCVPNRDGLGFRGQLKGYSRSRYPFLQPSFIDPYSIIHLMTRNGYRLRETDYIDCPPWPDIGMTKEDFTSKLLGREPHHDHHSDPDTALSILPYYKGEDPGFNQRMLRLSGLERYAPQSFKRYWAHHRYLLFHRD
ncbi:MAG TPA: methyltransferase domain-containing protein [Candidatus Cloacimonadota bacterium]|nr:methyltransferase domain-containing protein [Candidatus Cloacimonadota bacterium]